MLQFSTEGLTILLALELLEMTSTTDSASSIPEGPEEQEAWLERLARELVDTCWHPPEQCKQSLVSAGYMHREHTEPQSHDDDTEEEYPYCWCRKGECHMSLIHCFSPTNSYQMVIWTVTTTSVTYSRSFLSCYEQTC